MKEVWGHMAGDGVFPMRVRLFCWLLFPALLWGCEGYRTDRLVQELAAKEAEVRMNAAIALGTRNDPRAVPPLIAALRDPDRHVRDGAEGALVALGPAALDGLSASLQDRGEASRPAVARILGKITDVRGMDPLKGVLGEANPALAREARAALLKVLPVALKDSRTEVRLKAAGWLQDLPDPVAVEPLVEALRDPDVNVRRRAATALGRIGQPAGRALLGLMRDPDPQLRRTAVEQLGRIRHPDLLEPLLAALRDPDADVQWWAAWALGELGPPAEGELKKRLRDPDRAVQHWAREALNKIKGIPFDQPPR
jgi:HEAT repeat protein